MRESECPALTDLVEEFIQIGFPIFNLHVMNVCVGRVRVCVATEKTESSCPAVFSVANRLTSTFHSTNNVSKAVSRRRRLNWILYTSTFPFVLFPFLLPLLLSCVVTCYFHFKRNFTHTHKDHCSKG